MTTQKHSPCCQPQRQAADISVHSAPPYLHCSVFIEQLREEDSHKRHFCSVSVQAPLSTAWGTLDGKLSLSNQAARPTRLDVYKPDRHTLPLSGVCVMLPL